MDYSVKFGRAARTIEHYDDNGAMIFCFDIEPLPDKRCAIHVEGHPHNKRPIPQALQQGTDTQRAQQALDHVREFLANHGYEVDIC